MDRWIDRWMIDSLSYLTHIYLLIYITSVKEEKEFSETSVYIFWPLLWRKIRPGGLMTNSLVTYRIWNLLSSIAVTQWLHAFSAVRGVGGTVILHKPVPLFKSYMTHTSFLSWKLDHLSLRGRVSPCSPLPTITSPTPPHTKQAHIPKACVFLETQWHNLNVV